MLDRLLDRPVSVTMVLLVFMVLGIVGIRRLPVSLAPDVDVPYLTVQVNESDMAAAELENVVVRPIRQSLAQIDRIRDIRSETSDGTATITIEFSEGQNMDLSYIEVNEKVDRVMGSLPRMDRPKVIRASATDIPAFYLNVTLKDGSSFLKMSEFAEDVIAKRLEQLPEVAMVDISGVAGREVLVIPNQEKLSSLGLSVRDFQSSITSADVSLGNLTIRDGEYHYNVRFRSQASSAEDLSNIYFKSGDRLLQVRDVARVTEHEAPRQGLALSDGKDAVLLAVIKQSEARMSALRSSISDQVAQLTKDYPQMEFTVTRDQTELLDYSISNLMKNIILAIVLVCVILLVFMKDLRTPVLVAMTIPVSLVISFFVFYLIGLSINIVSLSGVLLGVGMMVDNAIILTDNISASWQKGRDLRASVIDGTSEVMGAMLSSVLTTCSVFLPLIFLNGLAGDLFYDQAVSVSVVLLTSYAVTITAVPVYFWVLFRKSGGLRAGKPRSEVPSRSAMDLYDRIEDWGLSNRWLCWLLPSVSAAAVVLCVIFMEREKLPPLTHTDTVLNIDWNEHVTLEENRSRVSQLEELIGEDALQSTAMIGVQQFVLSRTSGQSADDASIYFRCIDAESLERNKTAVMTYLSGHYPGAIAEFSNSGNIFEMIFSQSEPQLLARLRPSEGTDLRPDRLEAVISDISSALPGVETAPVAVKQNVLYTSDPELMSLYGVNFSDLLSVLRNALNGNTLFEMVQGSRSVPVVMGTDILELEEMLSQATVTVRDGDDVREIPARALMKQTFELDMKTIVAGEDGVYYPLGLDMPSGKVRASMAKVHDAVLRHAGFDVGFSGAWFTDRKMIEQMFLVLLVALALLYLILASQFESLLQPLVILSEIVIDAAFSLLCIWMLGVSINIMSLIGIVVISGIVINDSILKIDTINKLARSGMEIRPAIHEAGHRRLKSIVMTSLTTILAVAPFLSRGSIGADLQYPMALVIIIGMIVGTAVSLFYVPAMYHALYRRHH